MAQFITDAELQAALEGVLMKPAGTLTSGPTGLPPWGVVITQANTQAYNDIVEKLTIRGYTQTQIAGWDYGVTYETMIGLYWCLYLGAALHNYDDKFVEKYRVYRDRLEDTLVIVGGTIT
jgi:hypothetical protein